MNDTAVDIQQLVERLDQSIGAMTRTAAIRRLYQRLAGASGASLERSSYLALKHLSMDGPTRITDLAHEHGVEASTMSRHVRVLEDASLVVKRPDPADGRVSLADATAKGRRIVTKVETERQNMFRTALSSWDPDDAESFVDLIERFHADITRQLEEK